MQGCTQKYELRLGYLGGDGAWGHSFEQVYRGNEQVPCTSWHGTHIPLKHLVHLFMDTAHKVIGLTQDFLQVIKFPFRTRSPFSLLK